MPKDDSLNPHDFVQSLERGLEVIKAFTPEQPALSVSDVAAITGLTRAAARRFLLTLVSLGYMRAEGRVYLLRPKVLELGYAYLSSLLLPDIALPHLRELAQEARESCSVAVLDGDEVLYVARIPSGRLMSMNIQVGTKLPAYATSMGRVLLSGQPDEWIDGYLARVDLKPITARTVTDPVELKKILADVRATGYSLVDQELEESLRSVAVPVRWPDSGVTAALNVTAHASRGPTELMLTDLLGSLQRTAQAVEEDLAHVARVSPPAP